MSKCPACGNALYVPTPENEIEELPLSPEDISDLRKEAMLQEERRRLDSLLAREANSGTEDRSAGRPQPESASGRPTGAKFAGPETTAGGGRMEAALARYLVAMRDSDFDGAERATATLRLQPRTVRELIDRLAADPVPPPEMAHVPVGVYQGFLKTLRSRL
jgi:hypothetical protein